MSVGDAPAPLISFGRVAPPPEHWPSIVATLGSAPEAVGASPPPKSLPLYRWRNPRAHAQLAGRGCCVGESIADMLELNCRMTDPPQPPPDLRLNDDAPMFSPLWIYYIARRYSAQQGRPLSGDGAIVSDALAAVVQQGVIPWNAWPGTEANYRNYTDAAPPASALAARRYKVSGEAQRLASADQILHYLGVKNRAVVVGTPWRGGMTTARDGTFSWGAGVVGGHAYCLSSYDLAPGGTGRVGVDNSWDNAGWGVQPAQGAADATGHLLPRGYGFTSWPTLAAIDLSPAAFSNGSTEAIVITGLDWQDQPKPTPTPTPDPTPTPPQPPSPTPWTGLTIDGRLVINGRDHLVTVRPL